MFHTDNNILNKGVHSSQVTNLTTGVIHCDWHPVYHLSDIDVSPHVLYYFMSFEIFHTFLNYFPTEITNYVNFHISSSVMNTS